MGNAQDQRSFFKRWTRSYENLAFAALFAGAVAGVYGGRERIDDLGRTDDDCGDEVAGAGAATVVKPACRERQPYSGRANLLRMSGTHPVLEKEAQLVAAQLRGDVGALDRLLAPDLIYTTFTGEMGRKDDDLAVHRSGRLRITRMEVKEREVRDFGAAVVVVVLMDTSAEIDGASTSKLLRYTRVWTRGGGDWRLSVAHIGEVVRSELLPDGAAAES